jgi:3-oxoacyl-[acyl-carrier protein] reductase
MPTRPLPALLALSEQVAIITGASRGIGRSIAEVFRRAGAKLSLVARTAESLRELARNLSTEGGPADVLALPADVAVENQVNEVVRRTLEAFGRVDILVNNAGLISAGSIGKIEPAEWERVIGANLTGAYLFSRAVAPVMERQKGGRIINIASISAQTGGVSGGVHYSSSKGGMIAMTKTLARDLAPFGVTVNAIAPGQIDTDPKLLTPEGRQRIINQIPLGRLGVPEDVAYAALFLATPMASYITGTTLDVNGGMLKR